MVKLKEFIVADLFKVKAIDFNSAVKKVVNAVFGKKNK